MEREIKTELAIVKIPLVLWSMLTSLAIIAGLLVNYWRPTDSGPAFPKLSDFQPNLFLFAIGTLFVMLGAVVIANQFRNNVDRRKTLVDMLFWGVSPLVIGLLVCLRYFHCI